MSLSSLIVVSKRFGNLNGEKKRPAGLWKYIFFLPHRIVLSVKRDSSGSSILAVPPPPFYCHSVELLQVTKTNLCPPRLLGCSLLRTHSFGRVSMHLALKFSSRNRSYIIINIDFSLISIPSSSPSRDLPHSLAFSHGILAAVFSTPRRSPPRGSCLKFPPRHGQKEEREREGIPLSVVHRRAKNPSTSSTVITGGRGGGAAGIN